METVTFDTVPYNPLDFGEPISKTSSAMFAGTSRIGKG
jgi:hypothetical protein